jgi:hypothetical protein
VVGGRHLWAGGFSAAQKHLAVEAGKPLDVIGKTGSHLTIRQNGAGMT